MALENSTGRALAIGGAIIGAVVVLSVIASVAPTFFTELSDTNAVLNDPNTTTGDTTADGLLGIFPLLIGITGLFALVGAILVAVKFSSRD